MLNFTMSSVLMSIFFTNTTIIFLSLLFKLSTRSVYISYPFLTLFLALTIIRFLFPFELPFSHNLYYPRLLSKIFQNILSCKGNISIWKFFCLFWIIISGLLLISYYLKKEIFRKKIIAYGTDVTEKYAKTIYSLSNGSTKNIKVYTLSNIDSPLIFGIFKVFIIIPTNYIFTLEEEIAIFKHELNHFYHHDLFIKWIVDMIKMIYWWNPFIYYFSYQVNLILEIQADKYVLSHLNTTEKIAYLNCLKKILSAGPNLSRKYEPYLSLYNGNATMISTRIDYMKQNSSKNKLNKNCFLFSFIIAMFVFSYYFIFEPSYLPSKISNTTYNATSDSSYVLIHNNGSCDIILDGKKVISSPKYDKTYDFLKKKYIK